MECFVAAEKVVMGSYHVLIQYKGKCIYELTRNPFNLVVYTAILWKNPTCSGSGAMWSDCISSYRADPAFWPCEI